MSNINRSLSPDWNFAKFRLPLNTFYGSAKSVDKNVEITTENSHFNQFRSNNPDWNAFTQTSSRTIIEKSFLEQFGPRPRSRRNPTDSKTSLSSLPIVGLKTMEATSRKRSKHSTSTNSKNTYKKKLKKSNPNRDRSLSPNWTTSRFSFPAQIPKQKRSSFLAVNGKSSTKKRSSSLAVNRNSPSRKKRSSSLAVNRNRSSRKKKSSPLAVNGVSPSRKQKSSPLTVNGDSPSRRKRSSSLTVNGIASSKSTGRSASPDWTSARFSLTKIPAKQKSPSNLSLKPTKKIISASPRITVSISHKRKPKINKNACYTISQKTLDTLLPKPEVHLFDIVKYGPTVQLKDDFLFGLNLMRSEVLKKIDLLHYKKKLRNTGINFIRTFQQNRKSKTKNGKLKQVAANDTESSIHINKELNEETVKEDEVVLVDEVDDAVCVDDEVCEEEKIDEVLSESTEKLVAEVIKDFSDIFGDEKVSESTEESSTIESNISVSNNGDSQNDSTKETIKISETNSFYHSATKKIKRNSLDSTPKLFSKTSNHKRNFLPNMKDLKKKGVTKKKTTKKNVIKIKWPIARKSLLDMRNKT